MRRCVFSPRAARSLFRIQDYIARDKPRAAREFAEEIERVCKEIAMRPGMGRRRSDLRKGLHMFPHGNYLIYYTVADASIEIYDVYHARRKPKRRFRR